MQLDPGAPGRAALPVPPDAHGPHRGARAPRGLRHGRDLVPLGVADKVAAGHSREVPRLLQGRRGRAPRAAGHGADRRVPVRRRGRGGGSAGRRPRVQPHALPAAARLGPTAGLRRGRPHRRRRREDLRAAAGAVRAAGSGEPRDHEANHRNLRVEPGERERRDTRTGTRSLALWLLPPSSPYPHPPIHTTRMAFHFLTQSSMVRFVSLFPFPFSLRVRRCRPT